MEESIKMQHLAGLIPGAAENAANSFLGIMARSGAEPLRRAERAESADETTIGRAESLSAIAELVDIFDRSHWLDFILIKFPCWKALQWLKAIQKRKNPPTNP